MTTSKRRAKRSLAAPREPRVVDPQASAVSGIRQLIIEQLEWAATRLQASVRVNTGVHEVRKELRRVRAELRIIGKALDEPRFRTHNRALRDVARSLSPVRDAQVLIATLDDLTSSRSWRLGRQPQVGRLRRHLKSELARANRQFADRKATLDRHRLALGKVVGELRSEPETDRRQSVVNGVRTIYAAGQKTMRTARKTRATADLHEWRKRSKDLRYALDTLSFLHSPFLDDQGERVRQLTDYLGDDHDLGLLATQVAAHPDLFPSVGDATMLLMIIAHRREDLQEKAVRCGKRLYRRKPKALASSIGRLWKATHPSPRKATRGR